MSGAKWAGTGQIVKQIAQFATISILAVQLDPRDFGLVGMAAIVVGFVNIFKDLGTGAAVVQREECTEPLLQSVFVFNLFLGAIGTTIVFFIAPLIAVFFEEAQLVKIVRVLSLTFVVSAPAVLPLAILQRQLDFRSVALIEFVAVISGSVAGISMALVGFGVWSLVAQALVAATVGALLALYFAPWRPTLNFVWDEFKQVFNFSLSLTGYSIINFFVRNLDNFLIGKYLGTEALGIYSLAYRMMMFPLHQLTNVICRVMFPVFSRVQNDNKKFKSGYLRLVSAISSVTFPMMTGMFLTIQLFIGTFYGPKWELSAITLMVLAPVGMIQSVGATTGSIYQAKGRTDMMMVWSVFSAIIVIPAFVTGLQWGVLGVAVSYLIANIIMAAPQFYVPFRLIELKPTAFLKALAPAAFCSLVMGLAVAGIAHLTEFINPKLELLTLIICGIIVYISVSLNMNKSFSTFVRGRLVGRLPT